MKLKTLLDIATKDVSVISPMNCLYDSDGKPGNKVPAEARLIIDLVTDAYRDMDYTEDPIKITHAAVVSIQNAMEVLKTCLDNLGRHRSEVDASKRVIALMQEARDRAARRAAAREAKASS